MAKLPERMTCVLVGDSSLVRGCGEIWRQAGHEVVGVYSSDPELAAWSTRAGCGFLDASAAAPYESLAGLEFDYLFSAANLRVLSADVLGLARRANINFHDGLLPSYAGLNVPCWALINGERSHGVTWHHMTSEVDRGDVLAQREFAIDADETAFTLNVKCYEAALESFATLVDELSREATAPRAQGTTVHFYGSRDRPAADCLLDFRDSPARLHRLTRALEFGPYFNPMGLAKVWLGDRAVIVGSATPVDEETASRPGTVVSITPDALRVVAGDGVIELAELRTLAGAAIAPPELGLDVGDELPIVAEERVAAISAQHRASCSGETRMLDRLRAVEWLENPFASTTPMPGDGSGAHRVSVELAGSAATLMAALTGYLAGIGRRTQFHLPVGFAEPEREPILEELFCWQPPLEIDARPEDSLEACAEIMAARIEQHAARTPFAGDLLLRSPALGEEQREYLRAGAHFGVVLAGPDVPVDAAQIVRHVPVQFVIREGIVEICGNPERVSKWTVEKIGTDFTHFVTQAINDPATPVGDHVLIAEEDRLRLRRWNETGTAHEARCIHRVIEERAAADPTDPALKVGGTTLTYRELNERANCVANALVDRGVRPGDLVGLMVGRSSAMVISLLGILKAGAAYVPMDPAYPQDRLSLMARDSGIKLLIAEPEQTPWAEETAVAVLSSRVAEEPAAAGRRENLNVAVSPDSLCYVIYTSGSTGRPKGVMVEHRQVSNFFVGMDARIGHDEAGVWLAVTSISFDISVLELLWTLSRGFKVVLYRNEDVETDGLEPSARARTRHPERPLDLGLFYWNVASRDDDQDPNRYRLLLEGARFADEHGFSAVWTPERHFGDFGGLYPNPSVTGAAVAAITRRVGIRAGSCVVPLHHPARIAEEWSVVDVISRGRVGLAMASGWMANDFVLRPENFADAKTKLFEGAEQVRQLWRGETLVFPGPRGDVEVATLPRPLQSELPIWITAAGNVETFRRAAEIGAGVLTHMLGQSLDDVAEKIANYRETWKACGHSGRGNVTVMLHTLVGEDDDAVKELVREPMKRYLKSALSLVKAAAWEFPTFKKMSEDGDASMDDYFAGLSADDLDGLLDFAFERYYETSGLLGSTDRCLRMLDDLKGIGVDEIACLIDFGVDTEVVLRQLEHLNDLRLIANDEVPDDDSDTSIPALIRREGVTHFQCTPSMAAMLLWDESAHGALRGLDCMMVGGEALPETTAMTLREVLEGRLLNMYGPTETTIWSTVAEIDSIDEIPVSLGTPIANTEIQVVDDHLHPLPIGVPGELLIGGEGVTRGYWDQPELTAERFVVAPPELDGLRPAEASKHLYRTGDMVRLERDGELSFLGRLDHQVKVRGFRIELGEIEAVMRELDGVDHAVVMLHEDATGESSLAGYYSISPTGNVIQTELRTLLRDRLPQFMVPQRLVEVDAFSLTPNGKIDRRALKDRFDGVRRGRDGVEAPQTEFEKRLAEIWSELLRADEIGRHDLFFDLGGHSLLAVRAAGEIEARLGTRVPPRLLLTVTLSQLAATCESLAAEAGENVALPAGTSRGLLRRVLGRFADQPDPS